MLALTLILCGFAVIYIGMIVYRTVKTPRVGEKKIPVQVDSVFKIRVPLQADSTRSRQAMQNNVLPSSVCQVVFRNRENNEMHSFSMKEEEVQCIHENDSGILTYNGDKFIGFQKG